MPSCTKVETAIYEDHITPEVQEHLAFCASCTALSRRLEQLHSYLRFNIDVNPHYLEFRKKLILQKAEYLEPAMVSPWPLRIARVALIFLFALMVILPYRSMQNRTEPPAQITHRQPDIDFELVKMDEVVQLRWKGDPQKVYRVYKGPNPGSLKPVREIKGVQWVDSEADSNPIIFYKIEAL